MIVELEKAAHTIQLGMFLAIRNVKTNPYHTILIDMYVFVFQVQPMPYNFYGCI